MNHPDVDRSDVDRPDLHRPDLHRPDADRRTGPGPVAAAGEGLPAGAAGASSPSGSLLRRVLRSGTSVMLAGTLVATVAAYLFQVLGGRLLGADAFAPVTLLWSVQFLIMTVVMLPVEQLVIRRLELAGGSASALREGVGFLALLLLGTAVCATTSIAVLGGRSGVGVAYVAMAGLLVVGYTVFALARGYLAGRHRYRDYGIATAAEAVGRLVLAAAALLVGAEAFGLAAVMVLAPLCVLVVRPFRRAPAPSGGAGATAGPRPADAAPAAGTEDDPPSAEALVGNAGRFLAPLVLANGASQILLGIGPIVVAAIGASPPVVSAVFVTFALFRGPMWVVQSVLARVLPPFTALVRSGEHGALRLWALRLAGLGVTLAALGGPLGWWLGPDVVGLLFGRAFTPSAPLTALVVAGTALAATTVLSAQILVAVGATGRVAAAWSLALLVAAAAFVPPLPPDVRVGVAFLAGEVTALAVITVLALTAHRVRPAPPRGTGAPVEVAG